MEVPKAQGIRGWACEGWVLVTGFNMGGGE